VAAPLEGGNAVNDDTYNIVAQRGNLSVSCIACPAGHVVSLNLQYSVSS